MHQLFVGNADAYVYQEIERRCLPPSQRGPPHESHKFTRFHFMNFALPHGGRLNGTLLRGRRIQLRRPELIERAAPSPMVSHGGEQK